MRTREELAAQQADLLRAVLAGGEVPPGFDADKVAIEAKALLSKRRRVIAQLRPDVREAMGDRYNALFDEYAAAFPRITGQRWRDDAAAFAGWLAARGELKRARRFTLRRARSRSKRT
ncbi:hypothetical protein [Antrihabitans stalactiti]|uniref:SCO6045-like C-terminal domain-containing protein n=1 Tax=Antrihabitans stalactiti TaxID=2584121 RepID=A0A848K7M0_9NOCA|nr:hypothetical protein [Antrihabitans stalactiti]NMN93596.1 hypothetical protein [Antrihabitans stalactiti]